MMLEYMSVTDLHMKAGFLCQGPLNIRLWDTESESLDSSVMFQYQLRCVTIKRLGPSCGL